ncbi:MAG: hypothetical protein AVDCRST_MAG72-685 [uncultured Nocardioidaceae bacterium]|uniref:Ribosomally synthesized peptide with SipW-like signal peptide n=1 Tax=uncultured Nocardioidaceae bacterium TaxID=253824 RepID=A0A6J4LSV8_9ACTN|nr:MAG: hypothetical protein AVDCRST_MAG72-685 [uncultured Nocardioidaceae bacterium]
MKILLSRRAAVTVALTIGALFVGVAFASWTADGTGSGSAKATSAVSSTVTADTASADLYPGFTDGDLYFKVNNPNPYAVRFTAMTPGAVTSSDPTGCPASNITVASKSGLTIDVPANTSTAVSKTVTDAVSMAGGAPNGCQGVTFTVAVTLSGGQQ